VVLLLVVVLLLLLLLLDCSAVEPEAGHWQCAWAAELTHCPPTPAACRFGVEQRGRLLAKAFPAPHVLHMTATPIPRTQALIDHGDMSQVLITDLPKGRSAVQTHMLEDGSPKRLEVSEGGVVCVLVCGGVLGIACGLLVVPKSHWSCSPSAQCPPTRPSFPPALACLKLVT
jgi:hypothetical protein